MQLEDHGVVHDRCTLGLEQRVVEEADDVAEKDLNLHAHVVRDIGRLIVALSGARRGAEAL
eukprot:15309219-Heterocapsa_arctica.AAC.1